MQNLNVRIPRELQEELQSHCKTNGITQSEFVRASIESCLADVKQSQDNGKIAFERQLEVKDGQISELHQLLAMKERNVETLTAQLDAIRQLEDLRQKRSWWYRLWKQG